MLNNRGQLISNGVLLRGHESDSIRFLVEHGFSVELIIPSYTPHNKNADLITEGKIWELKTPVTSKKETIKRKFKESGKQSENVIIDLRFCGIADEQSLSVLKYELSNTRRVKRMIVVTRKGQMLRFGRR